MVSDDQTLPHLEKDVDMTFPNFFFHPKNSHTKYRVYYLIKLKLEEIIE